MKLRLLSVENFRSLRAVSLPTDDLTTLIGANGSGKSSFLTALRLLFEPRARVDVRDFWRSEGASDEALRDDPIVIRGTFTDLSPEARAAFGPFLSSESELVVERAFDGPGVGTYVAHRRTIPEFAAIRNSPTRHREMFNQLVSEDRFAGLTRVGNKNDAFDQMATWEQEHPDSLESASEQVSFFSEALESPTAIGNYLKFFPIGALEDPGQHLDPGGSGAVAELIAEVFQESAVLGQLAEISETALARSNELLQQANQSLAPVTEQIAQSLRDFTPGFSVELKWLPLSTGRTQEPGVSVVVATSEGLHTDLEYQGHGVQRSLMYGVLTAQSLATSVASSGRTLLLAIEEPEAFQHPLSARVLSETLGRLSAGQFQVLYSTHSPYFINPRQLNGLRLVRRVAAAPAGMETAVDAFSISDFAKGWATAIDNPDVTEASTAARLAANASHNVIEGLFARACVIVEGDEDEALLRAGCDVAGVDLDRGGVAVVQSRGKGGMSIVFAFLRGAGVSCYPVFDLDRSKEVADQHLEAERQLAVLLHIEGEPPFAGDAVTEEYAHWHDDFGSAVSEELGSQYVEILQEVCDELGYAMRQGRKVSAVLREALDRAFRAGLQSELLTALVARVERLGRN